MAPSPFTGALNSKDLTDVPASPPELLRGSQASRRTIKWRASEVASVGERRSLAELARANLPIRKMSHDVDWLGVEGDQPGHRLIVLVDREGDELLGIAPFHVHPSGLSFWIGEISVFSKKVERFAIEEGPLTRRQPARVAVDSCFAALSALLGRGNVVFLGGVPRDSDLQTLIDDETSALRRAFHLVPFGAEYLRCKVTWTGSYEAYLASLSARERGKLRRALKRFAELPDVVAQVRRFQAPKEVDAFLEDAVPVSEKTYQTRLLDLGLTRGGALERELRAGAARGYFLGHVLYVNGAPVAFHYGYVFNKCFFMVAAGYDPALAQHEIGIVLFLEVLKDIEKRGDAIELMDNLYGGGTYKERTSNLKTPERHYYLIPRTLSGAVLAKSLVWTDRFSRALGGFLERYDLKDRIKRLIRRSS
jgi:hypothetical protein